MTSERERGKLNEFAPRGGNLLEKNKKNGCEAEKPQKSLKKVLDKRKREC